MKLLEEEDKNTRKCQKENKIGKIQKPIVATMTPIVPRWSYLAPKESMIKSSNFLTKFDPIVATMDLSWPRWRAERPLENYK
jgi:hypothetical protein